MLGSGGARNRTHALWLQSPRPPQRCKREAREAPARRCRQKAAKEGESTRAGRKGCVGALGTGRCGLRTWGWSKVEKEETWQQARLVG